MTFAMFYIIAIGAAQGKFIARMCLLSALMSASSGKFLAKDENGTTSHPLLSRE